jgi:hypothetical protein
MKNVRAQPAAADIRLAAVAEATRAGPPCDYAYGTKRIMRCDHDSSSKWNLLAAGQIYLDVSCVSEAIGERGRQWATAEAP